MRAGGRRKRKASLGWWRFAGAMVIFLFPLAFILFVLKHEDDFLMDEELAFREVVWII